ncbi:hypothetical protein X975_18307, partial [Stegodyphus mimosarum]
MVGFGHGLGNITWYSMGPIINVQGHIIAKDYMTILAGHVHPMVSSVILASPLGNKHHWGPSHDTKQHRMDPNGVRSPVGKCMGKIGYFPSKYVTKLHSGEQPLQVIHTVHLNDGGTSVKLLNEQIVIQIGDEKDGMVMIRTGANDKTYACPVKYLKEV